MSLYKNALHNSNNTLPKWYLEAIGVYVSYLNNCDYCVQHHFSGFKRLLDHSEKANKYLELVMQDKLTEFFEEQFLSGITYAKKYYEGRSELGKELYESNPQNVGFKNGLAISYSKLGETHSSLGNLDKALKYFEASFELTKSLYESNRQNVCFKNGLAVSYAKLAVFYRDKKNDKEQAKTYFFKAKSLWQALVNDFPKYVEFKKYLEMTNKSLNYL
jgi:tetratricopeptide (TPR) repeat protein